MTIFKAALRIAFFGFLVMCPFSVIAIVGGSEVSVLEQSRRGLVTVGGGCSGVLISEDWVLTAGHCVPDVRPNPTVEFEQPGMVGFRQIVMPSINLQGFQMQV